MHLLERARTDAHPYAAEALIAMERYELVYRERRRPLLQAALAGRSALSPRQRKDSDASWHLDDLASRSLC